jgi:hypothetical protein
VVLLKTSSLSGCDAVSINKYVFTEFSKDLLLNVGWHGITSKTSKRTSNLQFVCSTIKRKNKLLHLQVGFQRDIVKFPCCHSDRLLCTHNDELDVTRCLQVLVPGAVVYCAFNCQAL